MDRQVDGKNSSVERQGDSFVWSLDPKDDLEEGGVYFLSVRSGGDDIRTAYIASDDRALPTRSNPSSHHSILIR